MSNCYVSSGENNDQCQSSSAIETLSFRVEPMSVPVFIAKLYSILNDNTVQEMVSWSNDGDRFRVYDIPSFSKVILPRHFKHSNWPSFVRQLNMYGFHKMNDNFNASHGRMICEFHHPLFYQNGRRSLRKIRRNSNRKTNSTSLEYAPLQQQQHHHHHQQPQQPQQSQQQHHQRHQRHQRHQVHQIHQTPQLDQQHPQQQQSHHQQLPQQHQNLQHERRQYQQKQHYLRHNIQCNQQITSPQESTQSTSANIASSSNIPVLSLLSSNHQRYNDHNSMDERKQSNNSNSEVEYQNAYTTDTGDDERNMKGKHRQDIATTISTKTTILNSNANNHRGYIIEGSSSSSNIMDVNNLTTESYETNDNAVPNQTQYLMMDRDANDNMDVDKYNSNHRIDNDDTDCQSDMKNNMDKVDDDDGNSNDTLATESYTILNGRLNQLRQKTTDLNSEVFMLRGCVTELQQSVVVLLDYLSDAISCSDIQDHALLDKIQIEITKFTRNGKYTIEPDNNGQLHIHDHHHHYHQPQQHHYHFHHQGREPLHHEQLNNNNDSLSTTSHVNDINSLKKGIRDILHRSRHGTELAKKNHHMHLHPLGYNWDAANHTSPTPLDTNNNNNSNKQ